MNVFSQESQQSVNALGGLKRRVIFLFVIQLALLWMGYQALLTWWTQQHAFRWLGIALISSTILLVAIWQGLKYNYPAGKQRLLATLGAGNMLTIIRGALICFLAGFLFSPWPQGWIAWVPGILYSLAALADLFDGYLARRYRQVTRFGEILDLRLDGLGVLIACILLIQYGQVPAWYLLVGLARYLFLFGIWIRRKLGKPVYELTPNLTRRPFAGVQMGFIAVVLFPVFSPPGTALVAALIALPFLVGFTLDWLLVSGAWMRSEDDSISLNVKILALIKNLPVSFNEVNTKWMPIVFRFLVVVLLMAWFIENLSSLIQQPGVLYYQLNTALSFPELWLGSAFLLFVIGLVLIALGAAGRLAALLILFGLGLFQYYSDLGLLEIVMLVGATALLYLGTGPYSLWVPEKQIIAKRIGEA